MNQIKPVNFYLMRHGETTDNSLGLISGGGSDPLLTRKGVMQAEMASATLRYLNPFPARIVSSSLQRARTTAKYLCSSLEIIEDAALNERHLGVWDGRISEEEQRVRKNLEGEETSEDHRRRVVNAINGHLTENSPVLFVCHGGTIRRILETMQIGPKIEIRNAEIIYASSGSKGWCISELG